MATEKEVLKLDLDSSEFLVKTAEAYTAIKNLGAYENMAGLMTAFRASLPLLASVAAAIYTLKKAFDFTLAAESIKQINAQFDALAESSGLAADKLREQIMATTKGLLDEEDALEAASAGIIALGQQAGKLPEIFELARKATALFGGEVTQRVEMLSTALASGNTRALRQIGIIIDAEATMRRYAASIGVTVDMLSEQQKKQAIMNEALEVGRKKFEAVPENIKPLTKALKELSVLVADIGEAFMLLVDKFIAPSLVTATKLLGGFAKDVNLFLKEKFGDATESAGAHIDRLVRRHDSLKEKLVELTEAQKAFGQGDPYAAGQRIAEIERIKQNLAGLKAEIEAAGAGAKLEPPKPAEAVADQPRLAGMTKEQAAELAEHRMGLITQMRQFELNAAEGTVREEQEREALIYAIRQEGQAKIDALLAEGPGKVKNAADQELLIRKQTEDRVLQIRKAAAKEQSRTYQESLAAMNSGQAAFTVGLVAGFKSLALGGKEAAKAMKAAFLNMLADRAEGEGALKIASGLFPPNPGLLASGAALLALSGVLRSAAGGGGAGIGGGAGGGMGGITPPMTTADVGITPRTGDVRPELSPQRGRSVTVAIQGNYFETAETRRALLEMIRQETDATSFQYVQIPQGAN